MRRDRASSPGCATRSRLSWLVTSCLHAIAALLLFSAPASAQHEVNDDERARSLFSRGQAAHDAGRYEDALQDFEASFALSGRPALLFNIGTSAERLGWNDRALSAYRRYLREQPEASNRGDVESRMARIEASQAPSPRETAAAGMEDSPPSQPEDDEGGVATKWWFWVGVAALVAGGVVLALLLTSESEAPMNGDFGPDGHLATLRSR